MCTSIAVGRDASSDGSLLVARNEDCERANWNKAMIRRAQPEWLAFPNSVANGIWTLGNGMRVPVPATSYAYTGMPDASAAGEAIAAIGNRFLFEERGVNSCDFAISATNSMTTNPAAQAADPFVGLAGSGEGAGLAEIILPTLLLPQARSASHALDLLAGYMQTVGASESNGLFLADPSGTWYVEIGSGHHWIAVRVPAGACIAVANAMRVHGVDLDDTANVRHSEGLLAFVRDHWLLANADPHCFDFAAAFGELGQHYDVDRIWLAQLLLTPSLAQPVRQLQYPLFLAPDRPVGPGDLMQVLRAGYDGTALEGIGQRPIGWSKTAESHVIVLDDAMPDGLRTLIWQCVGTPLCAPYLPFVGGLEHIPEAYARGDDHYGTDSAYWTYRGLYTLAQAAGRTGHVASMWLAYQTQLIAQQRALRSLLAGGDAAGPDEHAAIARAYCAGTIAEGLALARAIRNGLMTDLTDVPPNSPI